MNISLCFSAAQPRRVDGSNRKSWQHLDRPIARPPAARRRDGTLEVTLIRRYPHMPLSPNVVEVLRHPLN